ncbi:MAG: DUF2231 domain-containing protein [Balneolaceae bacterium]
MTPDWIPNIHPFIVHFPIALLVVAVLFDVARLFFKDENWLQKTVLTLYTTGSLGLIASFFSGREAVDTVSVIGNAVPIVTSHEDWALYTLLFFLIYTTIRFATWWKDLEKGFVQPLLLVIAFVGIGMLWQTGDLGSQLVYKHGVAVGETDRLQQQIETLERNLSSFKEDAGPAVDENGSWIWRIGAGADQAITEYFKMEGSDDITYETDREDGVHHLALTADTEISFLLYGENFSSIDGRVEINTDDFDGEFALVHHYQNPENYQYLRLNGSQLSQGQIRNRSDNVLGSGQIEPGGWYTLRVTSSGMHYYGYQNGQTVVHTHDDEMQPGSTGISIVGDGIVKVRLIEFSNVD